MPKRIDREVVANTYHELGKIIPTAAALGINEKSVRNILKELNIKTTPRGHRNRKYKINENFFSHINTHEKAYVLGVIWGDGNICKRVGNTQWRIELADKDVEILENIKEMTKSTHPITKRTRSRQGTICKTATLAIGRNKMVNDLISLGIKENKTEHVFFPNIDSELYPSFILVLIDSDGCIRIGKQNRTCWSIIGVPDVIGMTAVILQSQGIKCRLVEEKEFSILLNRVVITRKDMIIKLRKYLYFNDVPCLRRKKDTFFKVHYKRKEVQHHG